ncbi:MAG: NAD(P)-dependent oxidoreductase [Clostridia bacterium]|nr:NAD(P)-dependent oxidoreductase [Clostridia bacterium]
MFTPLGASNHSNKKREEHDYYATDPKALELLLELESFSNYVWECACGGGHLSEVLKKHGHDVKSTDIIDRGYEGTELMDFLTVTKEDIANEHSRDIITNPPYKYGKEFVEHALNISPEGTKIAMFLKVQFLEGKARKALFNKYPPKTIYVSSSRLLCAKNGVFKEDESSAIAYAWYIWEKGYAGDTIIKWFN